jgi:membrane peptidoglycan carboxypeptidase
LKNQPKVTDIFKESTYEEMTKMLQNWLDPETATEESTDTAATGTSKPAGKTASKSKIEDAAPVANVDDVASAFDSLFNK